RSPEDVRQIGFDVLRHRIILNYEAEAEGLDSDKIIKMIYDKVEVP
ncbi:MAG: ATPase, partial [Candidatus Wallbacteria bacterium]|nr:ATPase [Candidatus Wallbacteria bacterium]